MANSIVLENQNPGDPESEWDLHGPGSTTIEGFAVDISVNRGGTIAFKINTDSTNYRIDIYRLGYYGGMGARKVATFEQNTASVQVTPSIDTAIGLVDAGNWSVSASWTVPATAVSGVYIAKLVRQDGMAGENHIPFIVRDDGSHHDLIFQTSDTTWHAYNGWGGYSLYGNAATASNDGRAYKVSYNRPLATRDGIGTYAGPQDFLFGVEVAAIRWLEANGYDVCYLAGVDTDRHGVELLNHKTFLSVGHDEYWSGNQRANVEAARAAGVHLAFLSGNEVFWKTRWESSTATSDGSPTAYRTLVCYKETRSSAKVDPTSAWTGTWRDPRFSPPSDGGRPENALTGTVFQVDDFRDDVMLVPYPMTQLRFWRNTAVAATAPGQTASITKNLLGYEWDESPDNGFCPAGLIHLSTTTVQVNTYLLDYGMTDGPGVATHHLCLYRDRDSGALVFGAGTVFWAWGLDSQHDAEPQNPVFTPTDPNVQQAMVNLFADMGVFAETLRAGLVPASKSTDITAPTSVITAPANGATLAQNQPIAITGSAADTEGQVAGVEVSTDNGVTWHPASGTTSWTYDWVPPTAGSYTIKARAVDDSLNLETPGASVSVTVTPSAIESLFNLSDTPATLTVNDASAVELGVKFQSSVAGKVTAIRLYKGPQNLDSHAVNLWSATGALLSSGTSSIEGAAGWQQVNLSSPVALTPGTSYVASYHSNGFYSATSDYFQADHHNGALTAPANGNGVYAYGNASSFPANTFHSTNYWVDVVFAPDA
jgi:hypothetical protein